MNKITRNTTWIISCKIVQSCIALLINMFVARYLGPSKFGLITYAASLVAFFLPITQLGFSSVLVKELIDRPDKEGEILGTTIFFSICASILSIVGVTVFAAITSDNDHKTIIVCFLYSIVLFFQALNLIQYWFQAKYNSKVTSILTLVAYVVISAYKIYLLVSAKSIYWFALSNSIDFAVISLGSIHVYRKSKGKLSVSVQSGKEIFSRSKHYILAALMMAVFSQIDKIIINLKLGEQETGYYGAAITSAGMFGFFFTAIIDSYRPYIFEGQSINGKTFRKRLATLYSIIIYLTVAFSLFETLFANIIIKILYGNDFINATSALRIVTWATTFSCIGAVRNIWIISNAKQNYLWLINLLGAIACVILNFSLIPKLGICGAAVASLLTQIFTNVITGYIIRPIKSSNLIMLSGLNSKYVINIIKNHFLCFFKTT